jgi:hypothetical protein
VALTNVVSVASDLYVRALERLRTPNRTIWDADYALLSDPEAYDAFRRDPETLYAIQMRKHLIAGHDWRCAAASDRAVDEIAAAVCESLLDRIGNFASARFNLSEAVLRGSAWARIFGDHRKIEVADLPRATWWVPTELADVDKRQFQIRTDRDGCPKWHYRERTPGLGFDWVELGPRRRWFVRHAYNQTEDSLGYGRGLSEALYFWQYAKTVVLERGLDFLERWANAIVEVQVDSVARGDGKRRGSTTRLPADLIELWVDTLREMRAQHTIVHGSNEEISIHEASSTPADIVRDFLSYLQTGINVLMLGENLASRMDEGGSFAAAKTQKEGREELVQFNRMQLGEDMTRDLIGLIWAVNWPALVEFGLAAARPPSWEVFQEMRHDPEQEMRVADGALRAGADLRADEFYERINYTRPAAGDDVISAIDPAPAPSAGSASLADLFSADSIGDERDLSPRWRRRAILDARRSLADAA